MRKIISFFVLIGIAACSSMFAEEFNGPTDLTLKFYDSLTITGPAKLSLIKTKSLKVTGPLHFHNLAVSGDAEVVGPVTGDRGQFGQLKVTGDIDVDHFICQDLKAIGSVKGTNMLINGLADITGRFEASRSKLKNLSIEGNEVILNEVVAGNITIRKTQKSQALILKGMTIINGDIVFESGSGIIEVLNPLIQLNGKLTGGTIKE